MDEGMVAYLIHTFPIYSTTFISNEVDELRRQGVKLKLFAVQPPGPTDYPQEMRRFFDETTYIFPVSFLKMMVRHANAFFFKPVTYLKTLWGALTWGELSTKDRVRTFYHFMEAIYFYPDLQASGCRKFHIHFLCGTASIALFLRKLYGLRYSLTAHGTDIFVENVLLKEKISNAEMTRVGTEYNRLYLSRLFPAHACPPIYAIPFGIETNKISCVVHKPPTGRLRLLHVGRLAWEKNQDLLMEACVWLHRDRTDFHLTIIGEGPLRRELEKKRNTLGLTSIVTFRGALAQDQVFDAYGEADLFVLSSVTEGFGMVLVEAMAAGLPVIAPNLNGIPEIVDDGITGRLFQLGSVADLARVLRELADDPDQRKRLGRMGLRKAMEHYQLSQTVARFYETLRGNEEIKQSFPDSETEARNAMRSPFGR